MKPNQLEIWEELVGRLLSVEIRDGYVIATFSCKQLRYHISSQEGCILLELRDKVGKEIGLLRTDGSPVIRVRRIDISSDNKPAPFLRWWLEHVLKED